MEIELKLRTYVVEQTGSTVFSRLDDPSNALVLRTSPNAVFLEISIGDDKFKTVNVNLSELQRAVGLFR